MKYTLLDLSQTILSSTDGDEINSINDTAESLQIAKIIKTVYFDIVNRTNVPEQSTLFQLQASGNASKPVLMTIPDTYQNVNCVRYDAATIHDNHSRMTEVLPLPLKDFINMMYNLNSTENNVDTFTHVINGNTITFTYYNDRAPSFYTSFDDGTVIFDAYDSAVDTTLQSIKTVCFGKKNIPWSMSDTFVPDLDDNQFPLLLNEAKSLAFIETKQSPHPLADRNARRGWVTVQKQKTKIPLSTDLDNLPRFGRR